jgi:hypothetical protein
MGPLHGSSAFTTAVRSPTTVPTLSRGCWKCCTKLRIHLDTMLLLCAASWCMQNRPSTRILDRVHMYFASITAVASVVVKRL